MWATPIPRTRNPLCRSWDRIEAWMTFTVVMTILLSAPLVGWRAGREMYRDDLRTNAWERQHLAQVSAVLLRDVLATTGGTPAPPAMGVVPTRWTGPDGTVRTGSIVAEVGRKKGDTVILWVDERGLEKGPPGRRSPMLDGILVAVLAAGAVAAGLAGIRRIVIWGLDRRRLRTWQAEWLIVGPLWSHR